MRYSCKAKTVPNKSRSGSGLSVKLDALQLKGKRWRHSGLKNLPTPHVYLEPVGSGEKGRGVVDGDRVELNSSWWDRERREWRDVFMEDRDGRLFIELSALWEEKGDRDGVCKADAWRSSDGTLFLTEGEAEAHEAWCELKSRLEQDPLLGTYAGSRVEYRTLREWLERNTAVVLNALELNS